ncbi:MAG: hypothetical protein LBR16_03890 [Treponema sp.]|jgi:hypothetical protein|nr:hypothetical protein [Treponema sp.]
MTTNSFALRAIPVILGLALMTPAAAEEGRQVTAVLRDERGRTLSAGEDGFLYIWDQAAGALLERFQLSRSPIRQLALRPGREELAVLTVDGAGRCRIAAWDYAARKRLFAKALREDASFICYSGGGRFVIAGGLGETPELLNADSGESITPPPTGPVTFAVTNRAESIMLCYLPSGRLSFWDRVKNSLVQQLDSSNSLTPKNVAALAIFGANAFFAGFDSGGLFIEDLKSGKMLLRDPALQSGFFLSAPQDAQELYCLAQTASGQTLCRLTRDKKGTFSVAGSVSFPAAAPVFTAGHPLEGGAGAVLGAASGGLWRAAFDGTLTAFTSSAPARIRDAAISGPLLCFLQDDGTLCIAPADYQALAAPPSAGAAAPSGKAAPAGATPSAGAAPPAGKAAPAGAAPSAGAAPPAGKAAPAGAAPSAGATPPAGAADAAGAALSADAAPPQDAPPSAEGAPEGLSAAPPDDAAPPAAEGAPPQEAASEAPPKAEKNSVISVGLPGRVTRVLGLPPEVPAQGGSPRPRFLMWDEEGSGSDAAIITFQYPDDESPPEMLPPVPVPKDALLSEASLIAAASDGTRILFLDGRGELSALDLAGGLITAGRGKTKGKKTFTFPAPGFIDAAFFDAEHIILAGAAEGGAFTLVNMATTETVPLADLAGMGLRIYKGPSGALYGAAVSPREDGSYGTRIIRINVDTPEPGAILIEPLFEYDGEAADVLFAEAGETLAAALEDEGAILLRQGADPQALARSAGMPFRLLEGAGSVIWADSEGRLIWADPASGGIQAVLRRGEGGWIIEKSGGR